MLHPSFWRRIFIVVSLAVILSGLVSIGVVSHHSLARAAIPSGDVRLQWATGWAQQQIGSTAWGTGTNTYCEKFVENAYGVGGKAKNPIDLFNRFGGVPADPAIPGLIIVFAANAGNGQNGHAAIYMGGDRMISVQYNGVQWHSLSDWNQNIAPMLGFVYPPSDWPGIYGPGANPSVPGGYCAG